MMKFTRQKGNDSIEYVLLRRNLSFCRRADLSHATSKADTELVALGLDRSSNQGMRVGRSGELRNPPRPGEGF